MCILCQVEVWVSHCRYQMLFPIFCVESGYWKYSTAYIFKALPIHWSFLKISIAITSLHVLFSTPAFSKWPRGNDCFNFNPGVCKQALYTINLFMQKDQTLLLLPRDLCISETCFLPEVIPGVASIKCGRAGGLVSLHPLPKMKQVTDSCMLRCFSLIIWLISLGLISSW